MHVVYKDRHRGVLERGGADKYRRKNFEILRGEVANGLGVELHGCEEVKRPFISFRFPETDALT
jgi:hypothetical protein